MTNIARHIVTKELFERDNLNKFYWLMYHVYKGNEIVPVDMVIRGWHPFKFIRRRNGEGVHVLISWKEITREEYEYYLLKP